MIKTESKYSGDCYLDEEELIGDKIFYKGLRVFNAPQVHYAIKDAVCIHLMPVSKILEIGAGTGALCIRLKDEGYNIIASGIESDTFRLPGVEYHCIDLNQDIPKEHWEAYDGVVASEVIEHLENPFDFFRKIYMMLRPNGFAFITTPNILSVLDRLIFFSSGNYYLFSPKDFDEMGHQLILPFWLLKKAAEEAGLRVRDLRGVGKFIKPKITWQTFIIQLVLLAKKAFYKEYFSGEFSKPNILMVAEKV